MSGPYSGSGSRVWVVVAFLLGMALLAAIIAIVVALGLLRLPDGDAIAGASQSPAATSAAAASPTDEPAAVSPSPAAATDAPAATAQPTQAAQPTPGGVHVVQSGESLFSISVLYGVPIAAIVEANALENPDYIVLGQELIIPIPGEASPGTGATIHYVASGESISSIALLYNVTPTELADANNIENWDLIFVGQALTIPGTGPSPTPES